MNGRTVRKANSKFLNEVVVVDLNSDIKQITIQLRRVHSLKLPDAIIAATAMFIDAELLANDRKIQSVSNVKVRALTLNKTVA